MDEAHQEIRGARAYLEAHIEQGPVLEREGLPISAVSGTVGVERHRVIFRGQTAHSGATPMDMRRDTFLAAAATALAVRESAVRHQGVGTVGAARLRPGIVTAVAGETVILVDQRHPDAGALEAMLREAQRASEEAAAAEGCDVGWEPTHIAGLTFPVSNLLLPLSNALVARTESHKCSASMAERTRASGRCGRAGRRPSRR